MTKRIYYSLMIVGLFLLAGCRKPPVEPLPDGQSVEMEAQPESTQAPVEKADHQVAEKPETPAEIEAAAMHFFDDANDDYDYQKGCEKLRKLESYTQPTLEFRRGRCDMIQGQKDRNENLYKSGLARVKSAAGLECEDAMRFLSESGLDTDYKIYFALKAYYKKQAETTNSPNMQYRYAELLFDIPGEPPAEATQKMKELAEQNNLEAISYMAQGMLNGKDAAKALEMLETAANGGCSKAVSSLISHYDFAARSAKTEQERTENTAKAIAWSEKLPGHLLGCRVLLENSISAPNEALQTQAQSLLVNCIEHIAPTRMACDTIRNQLIGPSDLMKSLPQTLQDETRQALIHCYERVIRHDNERPLILGELQESNESILESLKTP